MDDNIIQFPGLIEKTTEKTADSVFIDKIAYDTLYIMFEHILAKNPDFDKDELLPMSILVVETVKAFYMKSQGRDHSLHDLAEEFFANLDY